MLEDAIEAWESMGDASAIVVGFSIGGAVLGQVYEKLVPAPAQIVFLNSFYSIGALLTDKFGDLGRMITPLMETQWVTQAPTIYSGKVLVLFSKDDTTVPASQGVKLCQVFSKADLNCQELPDGGHRFSAFLHVPNWIEHLLPPNINIDS
jgi:hypothetical protein